MLTLIYNDLILNFRTLLILFLKKNTPKSTQKKHKKMYLITVISVVSLLLPSLLLNQ